MIFDSLIKRRCGYRLVSRCIAFVTIGLIAAGCATTISGSVVSPGVSKFDPSEARINVALLNSGGQKPLQMVVPVDESGRFKTEIDLPEGRYLVEALVPGFEATSQNVKISGSKTLVIRLTPIKNQKTKVIGANLDLEVDRGSGGAMLTPPNL